MTPQGRERLGHVAIANVPRRLLPAHELAVVFSSVLHDTPVLLDGETHFRRLFRRGIREEPC
jgi:hypothetical protein